MCCEDNSQEPLPLRLKGWGEGGMWVRRPSGVERPREGLCLCGDIHAEAKFPHGRHHLCLWSADLGRFKFYNI